MNKLERAIARQRFLIGTLVTIASPAVAEALSNTAIDWLFFDLEHSTLDWAAVQGMIQGMNPKCLSFIRIPEASAVCVKRALDTGCDGIIVPQVNSPELAAAMVSAGKFPPLGNRSIGLSRALGYGHNLAERIQSANSETALIVQIEHRDAVANVGAIVSLQGIDGVFVGPYDLSNSLGGLGNLGGEAMQDALEVTARAAQMAHKPAGIFVADEAAAKREIARGFTLIAVSADIARLRGSAQFTEQSLRGL